MIFVDSRAGSCELVEPLRRLGVEVEETRLDYGDLMFEGRGEKGAPVLIGIEFKKLGELVQALRTERLQGYQMVGMRDTYRYSYLFIEGELLYDRGGMLLQKRRRSTRPMPGQMSVLELLKRKNVLHLCGGLTPTWTTCRKDTLQEIIALYRVWTDKDLDKHKSHIAAYEAPSLIPVSGFRRTLKTFPHVGMRASLAAEKHFKGSLVRAVSAGITEWADIETKDEKGHVRRLGTKVAAQIVEFTGSRKA
jgi:ERCC4-type nuclease